MKRLLTNLSSFTLLLGVAAPAFASPFTLATLPSTISGRSGGSRLTYYCGSIAQAPALEFELEAPSTLKFNVEAAGNPTIYIQGPQSLCVLQNPSLPGPQLTRRLPAGQYKVFIGDRQGARHSFEMSIQKPADLSYQPAVYRK